MINNIKLYSIFLLITASISKANRCGRGYGSCPDDLCCSRYGWCGSTSEYCDYKCQSDYGRCNLSLNTENKGKHIMSKTNSASGIELLCKDSKLSKSIIVYYPEWKYYDYTPKDIPYSKLTHINYAFAEINSNDYSLEYDSSKFLELVETAHEENPNIKVLMSIGGWTGSRYYSKMASSSSNRSKFVKSVKSMLDASDADGIDIDWEYPGTSGAYDDNYDAENDTNNLLKLLKELREAIGSKLISAAVPFNTFEVNHQPLTDLSEFAKLFDYVNIMAYDFAGSWSSVTAHQSCLYPSGEDDSGYSLSGAVKNWMNANFPANKIVVGIPAYGRSWISGSSTNNGYLQRPSNSYPKGDEEDFIDSDSKRYTSTWKYKNIRKSILQSSYKETTGDWMRVWDSKSSVPFLFNKDTKQFITYDDPYSVSVKADYVLENDLAGMMMWEIEEDTADSELVTSIYEKFIALTCDGAKNAKNIVGGGLDIDLDNIAINTGSSTTKTSTTYKPSTTTTIQPVSTNCPLYPNYKCCNSCFVVYEDTHKWGILNGDWCSITNECSNKIKQCWSVALGYPCCSKCTTVVDTSNNKRWGVEDGKWCGIPDSC